MKINLISSSKTRAFLLQSCGIEFNQVNFDFNEHINVNCHKYHIPMYIVRSKAKQFKNYNPNLKNTLFADSMVVCQDEIFGKANSKKEALYMLNKQSNNVVSVISAMIFESDDMVLENISVTSFVFSKFNEQKLDFYIQNEQYLGKAGAMSIEGFNKEFIKSQIGNTSTAMGLNVEVLKAYL